MIDANPHSARLLSDAQAISVARKAAHRVYSEGSRFSLEELEQIACLEAIRVVRRSSHTLQAHRPGLLFKSCRKACILAIEGERARSEVQETLVESVQREARAIAKAQSWYYVRREGVDPANDGVVTCHVWSFTGRGSGDATRQLERAVSKLPSAQRDAARLVFLEKFTQRQAAERLRITQQAISRILQRAMRTIRRGVMS